MYLIDQHALAERIAFEKLRVAAKKEWLVGQPLLHPLSLDISQRAAIDEKIEQLWSLWFYVSLLSDTRLAVYAVPRVLVAYKVDIEELLESILDQDTITLDLLLDEKFAMKACKASIKAWQKLSSLQMMQLVKDGFSSIDWMFVCQHGRPFFVKIDKKQIDGMMDR
jgi:DNA mismatch repair protein MutL